MTTTNEPLNDGLDNTNSVGNIIENGDEHEVLMILGDRERIRYTGLIRAGVKVPKAACTPAEKAKFKELEAQGLGYDQIDIELGGKPKTKTSKLRPSNVDYFTVRSFDFKKPGDADYIKKEYADPDGKVRRIPIWFTAGEISKVIPHGFRAFDGSGNIRAVSGYDDQGHPVCRYVPKEILNPKREDWQEKECDPDTCQALAGKKCAFGGLYKVNVCGLKGIGEVVVPTRSWYGMGDAVAVLRKVRSILGRFDGLVNGQPFLELVKVPETVRTPDGEKQTQWIITIELSIDPMELARHAEKRFDRGARALSILNGGDVPADPAFEPPVPSRVEPEAQPEAEGQQQAKAADPEAIKKLAEAVGALKKLASGVKLPEGHLEAFAIDVSGGMALEDHDIDQVRFVYSAIQKKIKADGNDLFLDYCKDLHLSQKGA